MRDAEIENWALRALDQAGSNTAVEDARVEFKRDWGEPQTRSRQLAGLANAARGDTVLWIVGAGEDGTITGANEIDFATWWQQMASRFDGYPPDIHELVVPRDGKHVMAIVIETGRAPFVVKNPVHGQPGGGPVTLEVPWREGTSVRSARREDLVRILVPRLRLPTFEFRAASMGIRRSPGQPNSLQPYTWALSVTVYADTVLEEVVIPDHRCTCDWTAVPTQSWARTLTPLSGYPESSSARTTSSSLAQTSARGHRQLIISGPGPVIFAGADTTADIPDHLTDLEARMTLQIAGSDTPIIIDFLLRPDLTPPTGALSYWRTLPAS